MNFNQTDKVVELTRKLENFMAENVYPIEHEYEQFVRNSNNLWVVPPVVKTLKEKAKTEGLWNLFLPEEYADYSAGLSNLEYAPLAEIMGRVEFSSDLFNCNAPDTGNMEVLARYGTDEQKKNWLKPLLNGDIRSAFLMTEPDVASSDATNIECSIVKDGDDYIVNGRKWWSTGVYHPQCKVLIVMGKTDPSAPRHIQQSMILIPMDAAGVQLVRPLEVFGDLHSPQGHGEVLLDNVRVPANNILLGEGRGFEIAQGRLGPGRIHHCMRLIGGAQRALELMCSRAESRIAFGKKLSDQGVVRDQIAQSACEIEQARLLTLSAADKLDKHGNKEAKDAIAMIKVIVPSMAQQVTDRAIQIFGGMGLCQDTPLPGIFGYARYVRLADGPDEVHSSQLGKLIINRYSKI
ncbi:acyl-CoA dehydrogenase-like protein [marine gamma proteobacterium HTCC2143]|jgi:acyl-CoA dehydrogenase|uniref:Acyl-CoA dehydrogenase-like protein n=1 Tax=marine gamma proteobacterium HTCC2143 TaxID=247633 RepID=A0YD24_9GAMM|nr:acyl-CoA dehydrogenase-like protein [marine gamma proteobacterium HTCC2143]